MGKEHRISAGGVIIHNNRVLLVRYNDEPGGNSYLVAPGGGVEGDEGLNHAVVREVREETGLEVTPYKNRILFVEDLALPSYRITKVWFLCSLVDGTIVETEGARIEGISEVGWYLREQLNNEVVYPHALLRHDWQTFYLGNWETIYLEVTNLDFDW